MPRNLVAAIENQFNRIARRFDGGEDLDVEEDSLNDVTASPRTTGRRRIAGRGLVVVAEPAETVEVTNRSSRPRRRFDPTKLTPAELETARQNVMALSKGPGGTSSHRGGSASSQNGKRRVGC